MAFVSHPLFQELAPAVSIAVNKFFKEYKDFKGPPQSFMLADLANRVKGPRPFLSKRSNIPSHNFFYPLLFNSLFPYSDSNDPPSGPRADKTKKPKNSV